MTRTRHRINSGLGAAAVLLGVGSLTACSNQGPSEGWAQLKGDRVTVEYPDDWTVGEGSGEKWVLAARDEGASVQVADPFDNSRTVAGAIGSLQFPASMKLDGYEPGELRDITVDGADTALVQSFTYKDGDKLAKGAWIVVGQRDPAATVAVTIAGTEVDDALISHVTDTIRYEHSTEQVPDETAKS